MKKISRELQFVAHVVSRPDIHLDELHRQLSSLNDRSLVETLKANKVAVKFEKNIGNLGSSMQNVFSRLPLTRKLYEEMHSRNEEEIAEFDRIAEVLDKNSVRFILIKSDGTFPFESDNMDMLVQRSDLHGVARLLRKNGYQEIAVVREPHKFLFRKSGTSLAPHIHTVVEWEGTRFIDTQKLWDTSTAEKYSRFLFPSSENCVLITVAHFFFENHEMTIDDMDKIYRSIWERHADWDVMLEGAREQCWESAFLSAMLLANAAQECLNGQSMLKNESYSEVKGLDKVSKTFLKSVRFFEKDSLIPLAIPYVVSAYFFVHRVLCDRDQDFSRKTAHLQSVASSVLRRIARGL